MTKYEFEIHVRMMRKCKEITAKKPKILLDDEEFQYQIWAEQDFVRLIDSNVAIVRAIMAAYDKETDSYIPSTDFYIFYDKKTGQELFRSSLENNFDESCIEFFKAMNMQEELNDYFNVKIFYHIDDGNFLLNDVMGSQNYRVLRHIDIN